jgi:hypothetical protein
MPEICAIWQGLDTTFQTHDRNCANIQPYALFRFLDQKGHWLELAHIRVIISAAITKLTIASRVAISAPSIERIDIDATLAVLFGDIALRAAKKIILNAKTTAIILKIKTTFISNSDLAA